MYNVKITMKQYLISNSVSKYFKTIKNIKKLLMTQ